VNGGPDRYRIWRRRWVRERLASRDNQDEKAPLPG
jgi:hypothetical protein